MSTLELCSGPIKDGHLYEERKRWRTVWTRRWCSHRLRAIKARIMIDFNFYSKMQDIEQFLWTWSFEGLLCSMENRRLIFSDRLM